MSGAIQNLHFATGGICLDVVVLYAPIKDETVLIFISSSFTFDLSISNKDGHGWA